jgi:4-amino-4-deoxy-L-arabinose transferase-like glycosyltransferase
VPGRASPSPALFLALAIAIAAATSFTGLASHSLWTPDEPRDAAIGLDMLRTGDFTVPRLNGEPFLEKPPLYWWVQAGAYRVFGASDATARLPSAAFGFATLLVAYALGARLAGPRGGLFALGVLATTVEFSEVMHRAIVDPAVVFFVALGHLGFVLAHVPRSPAERRLGLLLVALAIPLSFLAKGLIGPVLAVGPPVLYLAVSRQWRAIARLAPAAALAVPLAVLLVGPWLLALHRAGGWPFVRECLIVNTVGRFLSHDESHFGHHQPPWYYLEMLPGHLAPWIVALPAMVRAGAWGADREGEPRRALFASFLLGVLLLSIPSGKRGTYLVPLFPAFAATAGAWCAGLGRASAAAATWGRRRLDRATLIALLAALAAAPALVLGAAAFVRLAPARAAWRATLRAQMTPGLLAALALAALAFTPALALAARRHARRGSAPAAALVVALLLVVFGAFQTVGKALVDPVKDLHPVTAAIARAAPGTGPVLAYGPNETIRGIINFDLDRRVEPLWSPEELERALAAAPGLIVVAEKVEWSRLPEALRQAFEPVWDDSASAATAHVILASRGSVREGFSRSP